MLKKFNLENILLFQCMKSASIHNVICQLSYGSCTQVTSYGCYDANGYRFLSFQRNMRGEDLG
jgi:hypothetical protein